MTHLNVGTVLAPGDHAQVRPARVYSALPGSAPRPIVLMRYFVDLARDAALVS